MNVIEISHLTYETSDKFGITFEQLNYLQQIIIGNKKENYILDNIYCDGFSNVKYKLNMFYAGKLIEYILNDIDFIFLEWNTKEWHNWKLREMNIVDVVDVNTEMEKIKNMFK